MTHRLDPTLKLQHSVAAAEPGSMTAPPAACSGGVMMTFRRHLVAALLVLILGCLAGVGWLVYSNQRDEMESEREERRSREVLKQFGDLLSSLKDAETGQRGFIITGEPEYLQPYQASLAGIASGLADLRRLTADNPQQQHWLDALAPLVAAKLADLKETIALRETQGSAAASAVVMTESGRKFMDEIRALVAQAEADEAQLLKERVATHAADNRSTMQSVTLGSALGGLALLLLAMRLRWELASRRRAETVLRLSEQQLRLATDAAELGIWSWQPDGDRISAKNGRAFDILGLPRTAAPLTAARFAAEFIHREDLAAFEQAMANTVHNGARFFYQGRFHRPDGALRWIEFTGQPVAGTAESSLRVIGTVQDITQRKQAEQLLAQQTAELATLYATAPVGLFFYDTDLRYVRVNPAMAELNGLPAELHIGRTLRDLLTPELADLVEPQVRQVLETGQPLLNCEVHGATAPRSDEQQRHWLVSYHPVQAGDGTIQGVQGAVQEITERKQAEEAQTRLAMIVESSDDAIISKSIAGIIETWNAGAERMFGYAASDVVGKPVTLLIPPERWPEEEQILQQLRRGEGIENYETLRLTRDGRHIDVSLTISPLKNADGNIVGASTIIRNITESKQAEQLLRQNHDTFFNLIQNAPFGLYVVDAQFRLRQVSTASQKVFSNIDPLIGRDFEEVLRLVWADPFVSEALGHFRHTLETGEAYSAPNTTEQRQNIPEIESYDWKIERITLPDGQFGVVCYFYDITERMQAQAALRESEEFSRSIIKSSPDCIKVLDLDGNLLSMESGQELLGIEDIQPFLNKSWFDFWEDADDRLAAQAAVAAAAAGGAGAFVGFFRTLHGEAKWWDVAVSPILDADGQPARLLAVSRDVTQRQQADDVLRQHSAQFETLVNEAPLGVYLIDADFRIRQVNPTALPVFGNIPELIGRDFAEVMHILWPRAQAYEAIEQFRHTLETGEPCHVPEMIEKRADRQTIEYYEWQINRIPLPDGRHGVVCYFREISERVLAQQKIRESEERYRGLFNSIDEGFALLEIIFDDKEQAHDYRFLEVNPAFEKQTGIVNATGKRIRELSPDQQAEGIEIYAKVILTGEPHRFVNEAKALDRYFDVYATRIGGPESRKIAVVFNNITERRAAEEALRQSDERFRALLNSGSVAIYSCDRAGKILEINRAAIDLWGREPKPGETDAQFRGEFNSMRPDGSRLPYAETWMTRVLKGEIVAARDEEVSNERPDGSRVTVIVNVVPLKNEQGEITGAINCFYDITERSRLGRETLEQAQALADLDRRKDEFLAMLSHELRNPLAALANAVQLMRRHKHEDPLLLQGRSIIERQLGQLTHLVGDLLEVSRISSGRIQLRPGPVAVGAIVERALETAQPFITQHRHAVTLTLPLEPVWLHADAARLEQVLVNLLNNAAKYTEDGGRIWLRVEQDIDVLVPMVVIAVRDSGVGIAPELLPHIFELFTQAERTLDRSQGGLGIGLSLVRRLVELHGGTVTASSVPGQGSEFVLRLPLLLRSVADLALVASAALSAPPAGSGCRVLLVDDNVDAVQTLAVLLEMSGHAVQIAYDGPSAIEAALDFRPEVVLLDIGLPGLDGYQTAQRIRQQAGLAGVVLIALTGYGQESDRERSKQAGFDHHLVKPASFDEIEKLLQSVSQRVV